MDKDCGVFRKGEHKVVFAYAASVACDCNNYILDFTTNAGNINDSTAFPALYQKLRDGRFAIDKLVLDAGYKTPAIAKEILDNHQIPVMPYKRPMTKKGFFKKEDYVYDEYYDCILCPKNQILSYSTTNQEGYRQYKSDPKNCAACEYLSRCTHSKNHQKVVTRHIWEEYMEQVEEIRHTPKYRALYKKRSQTIERVFADAKEKHGMRYTQYRGLDKIEMELCLRFASMNLKKLALHR